MKPIDKCPICGGRDLHSTLLRHDVPVHQNLLIDSQHDAICTMRGDLDIATCNRCGFVFNRCFDEARLSYGEAYENSQHHSSFFARHMENMVHLLVEDYGIRNAKIAEIGCGKGDFIRLLVEPEDFKNRGIGFDPSYIGQDTELDGRLTFRRDFFGPQIETIDADIIVCRHVIEHISDPLEFLRNVRMAMRGSPKARFFFETPCVDWILKNNVVWDFFYEHCSLFSQSSLTNCFNLAGFTVDSVRHVFNGQYLWIEAHISDAEFMQVPEYSNFTASLARQFTADFRLIETKWMSRLRNQAQEGKLAVWGAGAKGTTFVNLFDPDREYVDCLVDVNPAKQGHFVPGTGHPIFSPYAMPQRGIGRAIVMNPNYLEESRLLLEQSNMTVTLME